MNEALLGRRRDATADYYLLNVPWMDDWWFIQRLSSNNHTDEGARTRRAPPQRPVTVMSEPRPRGVTADLSGRSVYIFYLHPAIDTLKIRSSLIHKVLWVTLWYFRVWARERLALTELLPELRSSSGAHVRLVHSTEEEVERRNGLQLFWRGLDDERPDVNEPLVALWRRLAPEPLDPSSSLSTGASAQPPLITTRRSKPFKQQQEVLSAAEYIFYKRKKTCKTFTGKCLSWQGEERCGFARAVVWLC